MPDKYKFRAKIKKSNTKTKKFNVFLIIYNIFFHLLIQVILLIT